MNAATLPTPRSVVAYVADMETLLYDDGPQLVRITDDTRQEYIGMSMPDDQLLLVQPSPERLTEFREGACDLRQLVQEAGETLWYMADWPTRERLFLHRHAGPLTNESLLPDAGLFLRLTETNS